MLVAAFDDAGLIPAARTRSRSLRARRDLRGKHASSSRACARIAEPRYDRSLATIFTSSRIETRPNWAEISISALRHNFHALQQHLGAQVTICAVVKCNAYGHGVEECAPALEQAGATWFGVTSTDEGVVLRECGIKARILVMCGLYPGEEEEALRYSLTPAVFRLEQAEALARAAARLKLEYPAAIHLKIDTGMARLGLPLAELESFATGVKRLPQIDLEGVFSHLASSEILDDENTAEQVERYDAALRTLAAHGLHPRLRHLANSGAVQARPHTWHNFVRPGLLLYGYEYPISRRDRVPVDDAPSLPLKPVLSWKTHVLELRNVAAGQALGYGGVYVTAAPARIAVVSVGYGDGLSRKISIHAGQPVGPCELDPLVGRGEVLLRGRRAPVVGRVSMDLTLLDVTDIPGAAIGDEVVLIGRSGNERISAWDLARSSDTVVYETLCNLSKRVPRRHSE